MFTAIVSCDALEVFVSVPDLPVADTVHRDKTTGLFTLVWDDEESYQQIISGLHAAANNREFLRELAVKYENDSMTVEERMRLWSRWLLNGLVPRAVN